LGTKSKRTKDALTSPTRPVRSPGHIAHIEHFVQTVEGARSGADWEVEANRIADEMQSADAEVRARAVREICPCKMPWQVFNRLRKAAKRLQHDSDPKVAKNARHIEVDAKQVMTMEGSLERIRERMESVDDERARSSLKRRRERSGSQLIGSALD
jgi:hypothetical protein